MNAQDQAAVQPVRWTWKRAAQTQAFKTFSILLIFSAACFVSSNWDTLPELVRSANPSLTSSIRGHRKFGDFSANGAQYQSVTSLFRSSNGLKGLEISGKQSGALKRVGVKFPKAAGLGTGGNVGVAGDTEGVLSAPENLGVVGHTEVVPENLEVAGDNLKVAGDTPFVAGDIPKVAGGTPKVAGGTPKVAGDTLKVASHTPSAPGSARERRELGKLAAAKREKRSDLRTPESPKSSAECVRDADGSDVCYYGGVLCYDGSRKKVVLIDDARKGEGFASSILFQDGRWTLGRLPPESTWPLPVNNKIDGVWEGADALANATWLDGGLWIVRPETDATNHIWHNGLAFTGLLQAQMRNASGAFPPQDHVLVLNRTAKMGGYTDYNMGMLKIVSQPQTKLLFPEDLPRINRLLCANRGGITSYKPSWSTGPLDAAELRARAYEHLKIPMVDRANGTRVTVVNRPPGYPRHVENVDQVVAVLKKLGLEVNLVQETPRVGRSFKEQVLTMSQTGIFIAPHGGGLANLAWLPENAVVIELFPTKCVQTEYRNMAAARNLVYFGVEAVNYTHPQALVDFGPEDVARCQNLSSIDHSHDGTCNQLRKNYPFRVPLEILERTVRYALEHFFTVPVPFPLQKRL